MLAVAEQTGTTVKIWYKIPKTSGQHADVEVGNQSFTTTNTGLNTGLYEFSKWCCLEPKWQ